MGPRSLLTNDALGGLGFLILWNIFTKKMVLVVKKREWYFISGYSQRDKAMVS